MTEQALPPEPQLISGEEFKRLHGPLTADNYGLYAKLVLGLTDDEEKQKGFGKSLLDLPPDTGKLDGGFTIEGED